MKLHLFLTVKFSADINIFHCIPNKICPKKIFGLRSQRPKRQRIQCLRFKRDYTMK